MAPKKTIPLKGKGCDFESQTKRERRLATIVRVPPDMMQEIDAAARRNGLSRSAWMAMAARSKLDQK